MATRERQRTDGEWRVRVGAEETSAIYDPAVGAEGATFVFAHGAGGNMNDRAVVATSRALNERGIGTIRFNFLYREKKSGRPDPMPKLRDAFTAVVDRARAEIAPRTLIIGGRSMGGRAASMLASDGFDAAGLVLLAYPLHPPGKPDQLRDAHLPSIRMPVICFNGTRDPFCTPSLMEEVLKRVATNWEMHWVEGADHSFHVLKSSGTTDAQVLDQMTDTIRNWVARRERETNKPTGEAHAR
ncbi:MAG: alpha/beta family hydrolase [Gemmatimonadaceae bacterium]